MGAMSAADAAGLVAAGVAGGLTGSIAGLASVVTYPALLASGLSPIAANVTNTVALVASGVGSLSSSRVELAGQRRRLRVLVPLGFAGGAAGGGAVLVTSSAVFERVVPWLILLGALAVLVPVRRIRPVGPGSAPHGGGPPVAVRTRRALVVVVTAVAFYGGYFGAAAGVLVLGALLALTAESLPRASAVKNAVLGSANLAASVVFAFAGPVHWRAAVPLGAGCLIGGRLGPAVLRRVPSGPLRAVIAVGGTVLAVVLGVEAYR